MLRIGYRLLSYTCIGNREGGDSPEEMDMACSEIIHLGTLQAYCHLDIHELN